MNEEEILRTIFRNSMVVKESEMGRVYEIKIKQKLFKFVCSKDYPREIPQIISELTEEQLSNVYNKAEKLINTPMIYDLVLACVKEDELDLKTSVSTSIIIDYEIGDAPRITAEQFFEWVEKNQKKAEVFVRRTGKVIFESGKGEEESREKIVS